MSLSLSQAEQAKKNKHTKKTSIITIYLHIKLKSESHEKIFVAKIGTILQMHEVVAMATRQPIMYHMNSGVCSVQARRDVHRLRNAERGVDVNTLDLFHPENKKVNK